MKFFRYWTRASAPVPHGDGSSITCHGYSNESIEDAERVAAERARRAARAMADGQSLGRYDYGEGPLREEIIEQIEDEAGTVGVISRNAYGSLVINASNVFFGDIDDVPQKRVPVKLFGILPTGMTKPWKPSQEDITNRIHELARQRRLGFRLYRTARGFRVVETSKTHDPQSRDVVALFDQLWCDHLYRRLCKSQSCFRARVSPKPWRINVPPPPVRFPYLCEPEVEAIRAWTASYEEVATGYATCALIGTFGNRDLHPQVSRIVKLHDNVALNGDNPLA